MTVSVNATIEASIESVWGVISDFGGLKRWHPQIAKCEVNSAGDVRKVFFTDWWAVEHLDTLDDQAHILAYSVTDCTKPENIGAKGQITLTSIGPDETRIDWVAGLDESNEHAAQVNAALEKYYPTRIGHLRAALGLQA